MPLIELGRGETTALLFALDIAIRKTRTRLDQTKKRDAKHRVKSGTLACIVAELADYEMLLTKLMTYGRKQGWIDESNGGID